MSGGAYLLHLLLGRYICGHPPLPNAPFCYNFPKKDSLKYTDFSQSSLKAFLKYVFFLKTCFNPIGRNNKYFMMKNEKIFNSYFNSIKPSPIVYSNPNKNHYQVGL